MDVFNEFWTVNQSKSPGPDGISTMFLKEYLFLLLPIIIYKFNKYLRTKIFLDKYKFSFLTPIFT